MKYLTVTIISLLLASSAAAHSGRTDAYGGHNCSQKSKEKGLCTGYHYHSQQAKLSGTNVGTSESSDGSASSTGTDLKTFPIGNTKSKSKVTAAVSK